MKGINHKKSRNWCGHKGNQSEHFKKSSRYQELEWE